MCPSTEGVKQYQSQAYKRSQFPTTRMSGVGRLSRHSQDVAAAAVVGKRAQSVAGEWQVLFRCQYLPRQESFSAARVGYTFD